MKQIKGLDTLRAFAIFFVYVEHAGIWFDDSVPNGRFIKQVIIPGGSSGVFLFFVLSGFLITSILLNERVEAEGRVQLKVIKNFFMRRALRIFPIYYFLFFFLIIIGYPELKEKCIYYLTYSTNILCSRTGAWNSFSHTWTLCVEEQFYLLWPWCIVFVREKYLKYVFYVAIITGIWSTYYFETHGIMPLQVFNCFDAFGIGGLYAYVQKNERTNMLFERIMKVLVPLAVGVYFYWKMAFFLELKEVYGIMHLKFIVSILSVWLIKLIVNKKPGFIQTYFLENRFLIFIGRISYGIYLYHYIYLFYFIWKVRDIIDLSTRRFPEFHRVILDNHALYWIHFGLIVLLAWLSFIFIEKPILRLKKYFNYPHQSGELV